MAGVMEYCGWASQQNVSRFHRRQLIFSKRLPPSIESAHFENTFTGQLVRMLPGGASVTLTSPHSKEAFDIPRVHLMHFPCVHRKDRRG